MPQSTAIYDILDAPLKRFRMLNKLGKHLRHATIYKRNFAQLGM